MSGLCPYIQQVHQYPGQEAQLCIRLPALPPSVHSAPGELHRENHGQSGWWWGTLHHLREWMEQLEWGRQPGLAAQLRHLLAGYERLQRRGVQRTKIMGILNVTPDSFSDGGHFLEPDRAVQRAKEMVAEGADIIDVGAESTRPGHTPVDAEEELRRLIPVIRLLRQEIEVPISVDTQKATVAEQALLAGAHWVNDIWGLRGDPDMARVIKEAGCPVVVMHNRPMEQARYQDLMGEVIAELWASLEVAERAGIGESQIILDPGIGFGKTPVHNLEAMGRLDQLQYLGYPVLVGPSRKSFIGYVLDLPVTERLEGTLAAVALSVMKGAEVLRVHDVRAASRVCRMVEAMLGRGAGQRISSANG